MPEVIEGFFLGAAPPAGISPKARQRNRHVYRIGRVPRHLMPLANELEPRFGRLGREYKTIVFDKEELREDPTLEWVTPGHPLFECIRVFIERDVRECHSRGAVFYDLHASSPAHLDVFSAEVRDGRANVLHKRLFVVQTDVNGRMAVKQPTIFLDLSLAPKGAEIPAALTPPDAAALEIALHEQALRPLLEAEIGRREQETRRISEHMEISLNAVIHKVQCQFAELMGQKEAGSQEIGLDGRLRMTEDRLDELNNRLETRRAELLKERECAISNIHRFASAWVLPHPDREAPDIKPMVSDPEIERIAVEAVVAHEEARGWKVQSVEKENRGFDLISRRPHSEDPQTSVEVRFIEVKGRSRIGEVALTANEYQTAERLQDDFWLYVVFNCAANPELHVVRNPARLGWKPIVRIEHYHVGPEDILRGAEG